MRERRAGLEIVTALSTCSRRDGRRLHSRRAVHAATWTLTTCSGALLNAVQEIGEAAARVTESGRDRVPGLPWGQIVAMRHILVHVYWGVDLNQLWRAVMEDIPVLITALEAALARWPDPDQAT